MYATLALDRPANLVIHGDGEALDALTQLFEAAGFEVTTAITGFRAQAHLFDAIVADWNMDDGTGADLYRWIAQVKPWLAERVVFLADDESDDAAVVAPGRPMFRKGADSRALTTVLRQIVRQVRGEPEAS